LRATTEYDPTFQLAVTLGTLGQVLNECGTSARAIPILREAADLFAALVEKVGGHPWETLLVLPDHVKATSVLGNLAAAMGDRANALLGAGKHDEALAESEKALRIRDKQGDQRNLAAGHGRPASILRAAGRHDEADARYDLALTAARQAGDK